MYQYNPWITHNSVIKYSNNWIDLLHNTVLNPVGNEGIYGVVHFKNITAAIIPIDKEMNIYLVGPFRYPLNEYSWELPMGSCPLGELVLDGTKRELEEETGLIAKKWTEIGKTHTLNCVTDEVGYIFLAEELIQKTPITEETERLIIEKVPFKEANEMVVNGCITDALSMIGILKAALFLNY